MTIRPVDLNGMIQNTHEVSMTKTHEDQRPVIQQQNMQVELQKQEDLAQRQVQQADESSKEEFRYGEREGDGTGYDRKQQKKGKKKKKDSSDGKVFVKNKYDSFDIKI